jgi:hypothetical protein
VTIEKGYADEVEINVLMVEILCNTFDTFKHGRTVIEFALLLHLHQCLGNRPGAFLPNHDYANDYLRYKVWNHLLMIKIGRLMDL